MTWGTRSAQSRPRSSTDVDRARSMRLICTVFLVGLTPIGKRRDEVGEVFFLMKASGSAWKPRENLGSNPFKTGKKKAKNVGMFPIFSWPSIDFCELSLAHQFQRRNGAFLWEDPKSSEIGHDWWRNQQFGVPFLQEPLRSVSVELGVEKYDD